MLAFFTPRKRFPLEWTVFGFLDRPWKVNVKASVPITVSMPKAPKLPKRSKSPRKRAIG